LIVGTGYTDSGVIDGSTGSGNGMSYGPKGGNIHQPDEYVYCDSIIENLEVIIDLAGRILL
jgi:acetylornithine deacetylase/succinyl-diaminopimelate desuccinylase-like protein